MKAERREQMMYDIQQEKEWEARQHAERVALGGCEEICTACNGSGEGLHDGSWCETCSGGGTVMTW